MDALRTIGLSDDAVAAYTRLVDDGPIDAERLDAAVAEELARHRLVSTDGQRVIPESPRPVLEAWAARQERCALEVRSVAAQMARAWERRPGALGESVDIIRGEEACTAVFLDILSNVRESFRAFDKGPYIVSDYAPLEEQVAAVRRGVRFRVIYEGDTLREPENRGALHAAVQAGEEARLLPRLPMKFIAADETRGLLVLPGAQSQEAEALLLRPSLLFDALISLFEQMWDMAIPATGAEAMLTGGIPAPGPEGTHLLRLLCAGLTDEAIARDMVISVRTVQRRISQMQSRLGVDTRFQLGVQATRQGWL